MTSGFQKNEFWKQTTRTKVIGHIENVRGAPRLPVSDLQENESAGLSHGLPVETEMSAVQGKIFDVEGIRN